MESRPILTGRVERVDVDAEVDGLLGADAVADLLDDAVDTDGVDLARLNDLEATVAVVLVVGQAGKRGADTSVDVGVVGEQALLSSMVEVRAVVDRSRLAGSAPEDLGPPGVPGTCQ